MFKMLSAYSGETFCRQLEQWMWFVFLEKTDLTIIDILGWTSLWVEHMGIRNEQ
jgi:hypothetical protein